MPWWSKSTGSEMGDYLPDDEATLQEGSETIQAKSRDEAEKECKDVADQYGSVSSKVEDTEEDNTWNCKFKFWG